MESEITMRARKRSLPLVTALAFALALLLAPAASAAEPPPTPSAGGRPQAEASTAVAATTCYVTPKAGVNAVRVHTQPSVTSTRIGIIYPGQRAVASCSATAGGYYSDCGGSTWWIRVTWSGRTGYVAWRCVNWTY